MRHLAVVVAAALVFAVIAPAFAQPFADVPTNHWAYDAIAELAAKGLIEGYPDGTFKGDRAMTRYEMAMIVARLLARIESIQIPSPQAPQVTRADLDAIQRLVNEFRAELAALGVRVTALEEELNAIKARLDNVRITGAVRIRYQIAQSATGGSVFGAGNNPRARATDASSSALLPDVFSVFGIRFDGSVAPDVHLIFGMFANGTSCQTSGCANLDFNSSNFGFVSPVGAGTQQAVLGAVDLLFFDWKNAFGWPVEFWLGRFGGGKSGQQIGKTYPIKFGPFGLIMNTTSNIYGDSTLNTGSLAIDGLAMFGNWPGLADLKVQALIARIVGGVGGTSYFSGEDAYGFDANVRLLPGLRLGGAYVSNNFTNVVGIPTAVGVPNALWHLYGPSGAPMLNPATPNCPATPLVAGSAAGGIRCPASGSGYEGYVQWDIFPGLHFDGAYAGWNDAVQGGTDTGWQVNFALDMGNLTGVGHNFALSLGYASFGQNFYPPYGGEQLDFYSNGPPTPLMNNSFWPGDAQGFLGRLSFDPVPGWTIYGAYVTGNWIVNGLGFNEYEIGVVNVLAPSVQWKALVRNVTANGVTQTFLYRWQLDYNF